MTGQQPGREELKFWRGPQEAGNSLRAPVAIEFTLKHADGSEERGHAGSVHPRFVSTVFQALNNYDTLRAELEEQARLLGKREAALLAKLEAAERDNAALAEENERLHHALTMYVLSDECVNTPDGAPDCPPPGPHVSCNWCTGQEALTPTSEVSPSPKSTNDVESPPTEGRKENG